MTNALNNDTVQIDAKEYSAFSEYLKEACGISLGENKQYLVSTRIRRILIDHDLKTLGELTDKIKSDRERALRQKVIDAMTTNETFWFRDSYPYDYLANTLIPEFNQKNTSGKLMRMWSAACSTGQEPYSISMILEESSRNKFGSKGADGEILATDLSSEALDIAKRGVYDKISVVRGLSDKRMKEFFDQVDEQTWHVGANISRRIRFRSLNLQDSFILLGKFDVIFCRNVLIYFSLDLKNQILTKLHGALNPGGVLILGSSESITGVNHLFDMINCRPGVAYRAK